jgi:hypothetical protein
MSISILDIIHSSVFYLKICFDAGFRLRLQLETIQMKPIERVSVSQQSECYDLRQGKCFIHIYT